MRKSTVEFDEALTKLNLAQRKAVETTEGPVLAIAGPGTGKTQILALRIGNILLGDNANPDNILCLTFTDAGSVAMRDRLQSLIGSDSAKIAVHTFHSFCNTVIQENTNLFPIKSLETADPLDLQFIFEELEQELPNDSVYRNFKNPSSTAKELKELFNIMGREGIDHEDIIRACKADIDQIIALKSSEEEFRTPTEQELYDAYYYKKKYKEYQKGDLKVSKMKDLEYKYDKIIEFSALYPRYAAIKADKGMYDFDDMIKWVLGAFESNKNLLYRYQEKFQYFLIDEFQDTNGTQKALIYKLLDGQDQPNVFVVGDDDQSVYRFQGASIENLKEFVSKYNLDVSGKPLLEKIVLTHNYRSSQRILTIAKQCIEHNQSSRLVSDKTLNLDKDIIASNSKYKDIDAKPKLSIYNDQHEEFASILHQIDKLIKSGVNPNEIAIIYQGNKTGQAFIPYCDALGIKYAYSFNINVLEHPLIQGISDVLKLLYYRVNDYHKSDLRLVELLHASWFELKPALIVSAFVQYKKQVRTDVDGYKFYDYLLTNRDDTIDSKLRNTIGSFEQLIKLSKSASAEQLISGIFTELGILNYVFKHEDKYRLLSILRTFFEFIRKQAKSQGRLDLKDINATIELMNSHNVPLSYANQFYTNDAIHLLTAHKSKGLEFDHVFVVNCIEKEWEKSGRNDVFTFPRDLFLNPPSKMDELEEKRRLFFVAITRARQQVHFSYSKQANGKEVSKSIFVEELHKEDLDIVDYSNADAVQQKELNEQAFMYAFASINAEVKPKIELINDALLSEQLKKQKLNASNIDSYLNCPLRFYYNTVLKVPQPKSIYIEFGTLMHNLLESALDNYRTFGVHVSLEELLAQFELQAKNLAYVLSEEESQNLIKHAHKILPNIHENLIKKWDDTSIPEKTLSTVVDTVELNGKVDRIDTINGNVIRIIDYKTGSYNSDKFKVGTQMNEPFGSYWLQGAVYAILAESVYPGKTVEVSFVFLEDEKLKSVAVDINFEVKDKVKKWISAVHDSIQKKAFDKGCGKAECAYCTMVKTNQFTVLAADEMN